MTGLTALIALPLLAALAIALVPGNYRFVIRMISLAATLLSMVVAVVLFVKFVPGGPAFQFVQKVNWIDSLGISYHVGVDGLNIGLVLMGAIVAFAATCLSVEIKDRQKEYYLLLMIMIAGILGAFASLDLFFFFFFHELALIPTFIMIGIWGRDENKNYATFNITLYLTVGALIALIGLIALQVLSGAKTFDIVELTEYVKNNRISLASQQIIFPLLLFGFGILVSLWPFHTWAPLGYSSAPTATAMLHAGVLKKFGLYGLLRLAVPLLPEAAQSWWHIVAVLCLGNILYCGLVAIRQKNFGMLIGNSSVAHMGFVFLGIASFGLVGITGAVMVMIAHGFLAALTFGLSGYLYQQTGNLQMDQMGGFLRRLPFIGAALMMAAFAGCGLPGFANFIGEAMVLFSAWKNFPVVTVLAVWAALVIGAVYMLRAVRNIVHGPEALVETAASVSGGLNTTKFQPRWNPVDATGLWRRLPYAMLLGALLLFGVFPSLLTEKIKPSAEAILSMANHLKVERPRTPATPRQFRAPQKAPSPK